MKLRDVPPASFQGVCPSILTTCAADGTPNVTYLSQVFAVDDRHVALSCQFFNKTKRNVLENPRACVQLYDPLTFDAYRLELRYDHEELSGSLFDVMRCRIDAIASHVGMAGVFKLLSADVYEVLSVERVDGFLAERPSVVEADELRGEQSELGGLQLVSQRVARATDLEGLYAAVLDALAEALGFDHSMIFLVDETAERLFAIATHGYGDAGIGAEVRVGDGLVGAVARDRRLLRVTGVGAELRYGRAVRSSVQRAGGAHTVKPEIPLPGLVDAQSQIALPLLVGDRLIGVLAVESRRAIAFESWHEAFLDIIANQVAVAIDRMSLREHELSSQIAEPPAEAPTPSQRAASESCATRFRFFPGDDCVFVDDEYLVRNMPGRILWKLLRAHVATGRTDFTNRELRLDGSLGLPPLRDNLESRLVLLRKRLEQKHAGVKMVPSGRGCFRLEVSCQIALEECDGTS